MANYPPESSWNYYPTETQEMRIRELSRRLKMECVIPPTRWQARSMQFDLLQQLNGNKKRRSVNAKSR